MTNRAFSLADDRTVGGGGDAASGRLAGTSVTDDLPLVPRLVATGVHVCEGDFGPGTLWLNTAFAASLIKAERYRRDFVVESGVPTGALACRPG